MRRLTPPLVMLLLWPLTACDEGVVQPESVDDDEPACVPLPTGLMPHPPQSGVSVPWCVEPSP